ncbi:uncharacterized protein LOC111314833 [Durio zibethinus]|uniref:Uncharacterized protein LOC111314833 n=1 Tax=Durio zibethinus TaxID=66656 RepID=A0A6P6B4W3_DURZI|nr:uncharacterized protein LOC111314833 [Durio zibethinus]
MADFDFLSDTDESAVEEVISQAQDLCVLEQLSAINCSAVTHSVLPSDLDCRFRRLKSLPVPVSYTTHQNSDKGYLSDANARHSPNRNDHFMPKHLPSLPASVSDSFTQNAFTSNSPSFASPLPQDSSPPQKAGCFGCSPKRLFKKQDKAYRVPGTALDSDEFLSDLATFSVKQGQKMLRKALKEQDKISREAEKIVSWSKQASARMNFHGMEDDLSDSDDKPAKLV